MWRKLSSTVGICVMLNAPSGADAATILSPDIAVPLPASWTLMLIGLGLGFVFYRLFSV